MSFGFSVGDLIGAANLTYRLIKALHGSQGAGEEYRAAIDELGCVQQALIRVGCLRSDKDFPQATFESASCIIMGSMDIIQSYLDRTKKYDRRLGGMGSSGFAQGLRKVGWTLFKAEDMKKLRETLHARLSALGVLLAAANLETNGVATRYLDGAEQNIPNAEAGTSDPRPMLNTDDEISKPKRPYRNVKQNRNVLSRSPDSGIGSEIGSPEESIHEPDEEISQQSPADISSTSFSVSSFSREELVSMISSQVNREQKIKDVSTLLRFLVSLGDYQLDRTDHKALVKLLESICNEGTLVISRLTDKPKAPISFKDAVGRKFSFPWHLCKTWKGMEELIKQAFLHVDVIGPHVHEGHYDLVGPDGEIILPQVWETMVQPGWAITMHMWPMPDMHPPTPPPSPPPLLPLESIQASTPPPPHLAPGLQKQSEPQPGFPQTEKSASSPPPPEKQNLESSRESRESEPQEDPLSSTGWKRGALNEAASTEGVVKV